MNPCLPPCLFLSWPSHHIESHNLSVLSFLCTKRKKNKEKRKEKEYNSPPFLSSSAHNKIYQDFYIFVPYFLLAPDLCLHVQYTTILNGEWWKQAGIGVGCLLAEGPPHPKRPNGMALSGGGNFVHNERRLRKFIWINFRCVRPIIFDGIQYGFSPTVGGDEGSCGYGVRLPCRRFILYVNDRMASVPAELIIKYKNCEWRTRGTNIQ